MSDKRAVCLNCIDGRAQIPVIEWIKENHGVDFVDMITEPGMDGLVADQGRSIELVLAKIKISLEKNNATHIFVVGHHDCKGNPISDEEHQEHVRCAVDRLTNEFPRIPVTGLWVNADWAVEKTA